MQQHPVLRSAIGLAVAALLVSCGREASGPFGSGPLGGRTASLLLAPYVPGVPAASRASAVAPVTAVRISLVSVEPPVSVERVIVFDPAADSSIVSVEFPLPLGVPASGLPMQLRLAYVNATGDTLFRAGPMQVIAGGSRAPQATSIPLNYVGPGAAAVSVELLPTAGTVRAGQVTAFAAVAFDGQGQPIVGTPVLITAPDSDAVALVGTAAANVTWRSRRGSARVVATLLTGQADTAVFSVVPAPDRIVVQSGNGQIGTASLPLPLPLTVRALAPDNLPVPGISVTFAVTTGGGGVSSTSAVTDATGLATTTWTLGATIGSQGVTATAAGLPAVTFSATAIAGTSLGLVFTSDVGSNVVTVTDVTDGSTTTVDCVNLGVSCSEPRNPAVNAAGTLVAVPFRFSDNVLLLDPSIPAFVAVVNDQSFFEPYAVAFTADGTELWVANKQGGGSSTGSISVVNVASRTVVAVVTDTTFGSPEGITIANGRAYVANRGKPTVTVVDIATRLVVARVQLASGADPRHVVATPNGQFVYASTSQNTIAKIQTSNNTLAETITLSGFGSSRNLAMHPDGTRVYVAKQSNTLNVVTVATSAVTTITFAGASSIYGVALLSDGTMGFASDESADVVHAFVPATALQIVVLPWPVSVGFTPRGIIAH